MNKSVLIGVAIAVLVVAGAWWYLSGPPTSSSEETLPVAQVPAEQPIAPASEAPQYPIAASTSEEQPAAAEETPSAPPMPSLDDSDGEIIAQVDAATGDMPIESFLVPKDVVRHLVATVDQLTEKKLPMQSRAAQRIDGKFTVVDVEDGYVLADENAKRYDGFISMLESTDAQTLMAVYTRYYPLFQSAYEELGYGGKYFNDRLVAVVDNLLAAPEPEGPITLVRPNVFFEYADPALEALPAGQKAMIRVGPDNERRLKAKLREFRSLLVSQSPSAG